MTTIEMRYQACNLCGALHRNINDSFESVSFEELDNGNIQIKIILNQKTAIEDEYIDDIAAEFSAMQQTDCVLKPLVEIGKNKEPLTFIVYSKQ